MNTQPYDLFHPAPEIQIHTRETSKDNEAILKANECKIKGNCLILLKLLCEGKRLTNNECLIDYKVGDSRRRWTDLKENGIDILDEVFDGRYKRYYLSEQEIIRVKALYNF